MVIRGTEGIAINVGQKWLTNPIPFVAAMFPEGDGSDGKRSVADRSLNMLNDVDADRLMLGLHPNGVGEVAFGLKKASNESKLEGEFSGSVDTFVGQSKDGMDMP